MWKDVDGRVRVDVVFPGGRRHDFIVDTGAMSSFITPALVEAMGLRPIAPGEARPTDVMMGFTSYPSQDVLVGGLVPHTLDRPAAVDRITISEDVVHGVLGEDFLRGHVVEFDVARGLLRLAATVDALRDGRTFVATAMQPLFPGMGLRAAHTEIGGALVRSFLDTGAGRTMINSVLFALVEEEHVVRVGTPASVQTSHGPAHEATSVVLDRIALGARAWAGAEVLVSDGIFNQLRMMDEPAALLGADLLNDGRAFILDYANDTLWLEVEGGPTPRQEP